VTADFVMLQVLNGLAFGMLLFVLAAGLSLIFGMLDIVNLAHGSFYMLGAYLGLSAVRASGSFLWALLLAPLAVGLVGLAVERLLLRGLGRRRHLDQVLLTFGLALVLMDLVKWAWGADVLSIPVPEALTGAVQVGGALFPRYRLFVIAFGLLLGVALWLFLERTPLGAIVRAGVSDREMVAGLGVNVDRVFTAVFAVGAALAAAAGVVGGPVLGLYLGMDFEVLILTLIVVIVGGLGSLAGAFWGALLVGQVDTFGKVLFPDLSLVVTFALMAVVLLVRPAGLLGRAA
jgi:branched-subunit amino acid ABC-type transport system permease component